MRPASRIALLFLLAASPFLRAGEPVCPEALYCEFPRWDMPAAGSYDKFGGEVVVSGEIAVVGAYYEQKAYVYRLVYGAWQHVDTLEPPGGSSANFYGRSIAITKEFIAVAAQNDDTSADYAGAVFLYEKSSPDDWDYVQTLLAPEPAESSFFGTGLAGEGELLVVGQPEAAGGGAVHLYGLDGVATHIETVQIPGSTGFGGSIDVANGFLVVGDQWDDEAATEAGAIYTCMIDEITGFGEAEKTTAFDGQLLDRFGQTVATDGETIVVAAVGAEGTLVGAVYVYDVPAVFPSPLDFSARLTSCVPQELGWFGGALDVDGDRLVVGSSGADSVQVFRRFETWEPETELRTAEGGDVAFGGAVDLKGEYVLVGAVDADGGAPTSGAVYEFSLANPALAGAPCPCDTRPAGIEYGDGKPGTLGVPTLDMTQPPVLGEQTLVSLRNALPGAPIFLLIGLAPAALPFDAGMLYVDEPIIVPLPMSDETGALDVPYTLSVTPAWCDVLIAHQVLVLDPGAAGPVGTAQTNGLLLVPGS